MAIADPDMIKEILMNSSGSYENPLSKLLFGEGLVGLTGEKWAVHRRITSQAFNMERIKVRPYQILSFFMYFLIYSLI